MNTIYHDLMILVIAFTCVGLFVATAIASALDLFNLLKLARDIRKKLHAVLLVEIVGISVAAFAGFLSPKRIVQKVEKVKSEKFELESNKIQLEKQITDSTKAIVEQLKSEKIPLEKIAIAKAIIEPHPNEVVVYFPWVDTASAPGNTVAAAPYLHGVRISIAGMKPQASEIVLINNRALYQGKAVKPTTSQNILTQVNTNNGPASFTLTFSEPFASVSFVRPALYPDTDSGITHPAWSAHALDAAGRELSSQSEDLTRSFSDVPARTYTLTAPGFGGISAIRFDSDPRLNGKPFAAFSAVLIEQLTMTHRDK